MNRILFLCKVMYMKDKPDGSVKSVNEEYLISAINYTQAETAIHKYMNDNVNGSFKVTDIKKSNIVDVLDYDDYESYWAVKVGWSVTTEGGAGKVANEIALVLANDALMAINRVQSWAVEKVCDFEILEVKKTKIIDFYDTYENAQLKIDESDKAERYFNSKNNQETDEVKSIGGEKSEPMITALNQSDKKEEFNGLISPLVELENIETPEDESPLKVSKELGNKEVFPDDLDEIAEKRDATENRNMGSGEIQKESLEEIVSSVDNLGSKDNVDPF